MHAWLITTYTYHCRYNHRLIFSFSYVIKKNYFVLLICAHQIYTVWLYICVKTKFGPTSRVYIFLKKLKKMT